MATDSRHNRLAQLAFCPTLQELHRTGQCVGRSGVLHNALAGLSTVNNLLAIRHFFHLTKAERTLEIGLGNGGSALTFASCHRELNHKPDRQHTAIDPFQGTRSDDVGMLNLEKAGLLGYVNIIREVSAFALPNLLKGAIRFDLIYIDGSHVYEDVFCDFYYSMRLVKIKGYILFDDCSILDVNRVVRHVTKNMKDHFERLPIASYRALSGFDRFRRRAAEFLNKSQLTVFRKISEPSDW